MLFIFRGARFLWRHKVPFFPRILYGLNRILFSVVLPPSVSVGQDVIFGYSGLGIVVHARSQIGNRVQIGTNVTIGGRSGHYAVPIIEDDVHIGAGACILGPIRLGYGCRIGANAVVLTDVPAGATAIGVPARIVENIE